MQDKPNVLLVEDTAPLAAIYQQYLSDEMINLSHVDTGKAAMATIAECPPQLVLLDLKLPDMEGSEILQWLQERGLSYLCYRN